MKFIQKKKNKQTKHISVMITERFCDKFTSATRDTTSKLLIGKQ